LWHLNSSNPDDRSHLWKMTELSNTEKSSKKSQEVAYAVKFDVARILRKNRFKLRLPGIFDVANFFSMWVIRRKGSFIAL